MADVALLYDSEDAFTSENLASALRHRGWTVVHVKIQSGSGKVLKPEVTHPLRRGHTVVALWSEKSCQNSLFLMAAKTVHKRGTLLSLRTSSLATTDVPRYVSKRGFIVSEDHDRVDKILMRILRAESIDANFAKSIVRSPIIELMLWTYVLWSATAMFLTLPTSFDISLLSLYAIEHWTLFIQSSVQSLVGNFGLTIDKTFCGIVALTVFTANMVYFSRDERCDGLAREFKVFPDAFILGLANFFLCLIFLGTSTVLPNDPILGLALRLIEIFGTPRGAWFLLLLFVALNVIPLHMGDLHSYTRKIWIFVFGVALVLLQIDLFKFRMQLDVWKRHLVF